MSSRFIDDESFQQSVEDARGVYSRIGRHRKEYDAEVFDQKLRFDKPWMVSDHETS